MSKYHFNPHTGDAGECRALKSCPFGGEEVHYSTPGDARKAYEAVQSALVMVSHRKTVDSEKPSPLGHTAPHFGLKGFELETADTLLQTMAVFLPPHSNSDKSGDGLTQESYDDIVEGYRKRVGEWVEISLRERTEGIKAVEFGNMDSIAYEIDSLGSLIGQPASRDIKAGFSFMVGRELEAKADGIEMKLEVGDEVSAEDLSLRASEPGPMTKLRILNGLRNLREEASYYYKEARPEDREGFLQRRLEALRVEELELEEEFNLATSSSKPTGGKNLTGRSLLDDFDARAKTIRDGINSYEDALQNLR